MRIIDSHAHLRRGAVGFDKIVESGAFDEIWLMDLSGISLSGVDFASREEVLEVAKRHKGRVRAFGFVDLDGIPEQVDKLRDMGFCGLKPYKPLRHYGSEKYFPIYERAQILKMPVMFHTGLVAKGPAWESGARHSFGSANMRPDSLASVAEAFPELRVMQGHMGWPYMEETAQNLYYYKNITCDVSGFRRCISNLPEFMDRKCNDGVPDRFFIDKIRFATDQFYGAEADNAAALKLLEFWKLYFEFIASVYYKCGQAAETENFFYCNARSIADWSDSKY